MMQLRWGHGCKVPGCRMMVTVPSQQSVQPTGEHHLCSNLTLGEQSPNLFITWSIVTQCQSSFFVASCISDQNCVGVTPRIIETSCQKRSHKSGHGLDQSTEEEILILVSTYLHKYVPCNYFVSGLRC